VEEGRESEYAENVSYAFHYANDLTTMLKAHGFDPAVGLTLDTADAEADFAVLVACLSHILSPVSHFEFSKLLDLENDYDFYHVTLNGVIFTILPVVLRGHALALYHDSARVHPADGRCALQRLRFEVEGIPDPDSDRFLLKLRSIVFDEQSDPAPQLDIIRKLQDKHARLNPAYDDRKRVQTLWHILSGSAAHSAFVTPLYLVV